MDPVYEFDAPRFVDFLRLAEGDEDSDTDAWFDHRTEDDKSFPKVTNEASKSIPKKPARTAVAHEKPARVRVDDATRSTCPSPPKQPKPSPEYVAGDSTSPSANTRSKSRRSVDDAAKQGASELNSSRGNLRNKALAMSGGKQPSARDKLMRSNSKLSASASNLHKTSEQLELEKISAMRAETARARRLAQESCKKALNGRNVIPLRSAKPVTMPEAFSFSTDSRLKKNNLAPTSDQKVKDFAASLRDARASSKAHQPHLTRPQPFKLTHSKNTTSVTKFVSDAEKTANFSKRTPQRFRSMPKHIGRPLTDSGKPLAATRQSPRLTVAKSPGLASKSRTRPVHALSREEMEQLEFEKHQKEQFKAHPVNHKILHQTKLGVPKVEPRPLTIPTEFALTKRRSMSTGDLREALQAVEEDHHRFHAKPVNPKIFQGPMGVKPVDPAAPTVPESPAFALKNRVRFHKEPKQQEEPQRIPRANRVPHEGLPFRPKVDHRYTVPEPFQVEERSKEMLTRRQQKIQQVLEEERKAHEFHASCLPSLDPGQLPQKQLKPATKPEPFELYVDKRGKEYQEQFQAKQLEEERRMQRKAATFKAGPNSVIQKKAFQPQASTKPLTEIDEFQLNTDIRAASREHYDQHLKQREATLEAIKRQRLEQQEEEERAAVMRIRKEAVHVAAGIKKYKAPVIKPSDLPLTQAQSPKFSDRFRIRRRSQ
ncbi:hypothetical protein RRG08_035453 [Elysia crispata]|uniref:Targeting protein for Xklp2 n=1 Tax=Elysia crispata TaxID=231223 RepID=A0AAE0Y4K5_9GAST|nr:hypothetical protein RRG08_035453 [Elysia crispata]